MLALILCAGAFLAAYLAGRRSLVSGLAVVITVGYFYGIVRANVTSALSHFIFDAAVVGLYATQLFRPLPAEERVRIQPLTLWVVLLIGWPILLLLLPLQDPMIRLVGLRAHIFLLPFLLLGARLRRDDVERLVIYVAALNVVAFAFALAEFFLGVERFYPRSEVTELIYRSTDIHTSSVFGAFRIPAIFANASLYGGVMVVTLPLLLGLWIQKRASGWRRSLLTTSLVVTVLGVFLAAARIHFVVLVALVFVTLLSGRIGAWGRVGWVMMLGGLAWIVSTEERLFQRFLTLSGDTILERLSWSLNRGFVEVMFGYPLGNGLGGGGSSVPYFLQHLIRNPIVIENHYATILVEQGLPGLILWLGFIGWVLLRRTTRPDDPWAFGRRLAWVTSGAYFAQGLIGIGLLSAVPFTVLFLLGVGWLSVPQTADAAETADETAAEPAPELPVAPPAWATVRPYA